ncbi:MAG: cytoplasmic protein [Cytophagales bacterium]|nr:MAG: cytoplasmic protein [Cytophagales bacterium]
MASEGIPNSIWLMNNSIYVRRKYKLYLSKGDNKLADIYLQNLLKNIEFLGFTFSNELLSSIQTLSVSQLTDFYTQLVIDLNQINGNFVEFKPMYPNFPHQVQEMSEEELYTNAFWHYVGSWFGWRIMPEYEKKERPPLQEKSTLIVIEAGTIEDFEQIFTRLASAKTSISDTDKIDVEWFIKYYAQDIQRIWPAEIPLKENRAFLVSCIMRHVPIQMQAMLAQYAKTATDLLRIATAFSLGDVSLASNTKFKNIPRTTRRLFLVALESMKSIEEDMLRHKEKWKRLGEKLHPFEYKEQFPKCFEAFSAIRNNLPSSTFRAEVERTILQNHIEKAIEILKNRPGEFARRLDHLLRLSTKPRELLESFQSVAERVSTPVLLQLIAHFKHRYFNQEVRAFFPKGNLAKSYIMPYNLQAMDPELCLKVVEICQESLVNKFKSYPPLGNVYVSDALKMYHVPFGQCSASKAFKTVARGSRVAMPEADTIRFFIYWQDGKERADIDLSILALNENSRDVMTIAYYNMKEVGAHHSGDIVSAPDGASEFIDLHVPSCLARGIRYAMMTVQMFTEQSFSELPICFAGFMARQHPDSGEIYEPLTVINKFDLTGNSRTSIPLILDIEKQHVIWVDAALKVDLLSTNNVSSNKRALSRLNKGMISLIKPNLYDLVDLHIRARGKKILDIEEANTIFALDSGVRPTDIDVWTSDYL